MCRDGCLFRNEFLSRSKLSCRNGILSGEELKRVSPRSDSTPVGSVSADGFVSRDESVYRRCLGIFPCVGMDPCPGMG